MMPCCYRDGTLCLKLSGGCLESHDVFVMPLFCTLRGQWQEDGVSVKSLCLSLSPAPELEFASLWWPSSGS